MILSLTLWLQTNQAGVTQWVAGPAGAQQFVRNHRTFAMTSRLMVLQETPLACTILRYYTIYFERP